MAKTAVSSKSKDSHKENLPVDKPTPTSKVQQGAAPVGSHKRPGSPSHSTCKVSKKAKGILATPAPVTHTPGTCAKSTRKPPAIISCESVSSEDSDRNNSQDELEPEAEDEEPSNDELQKLDGEALRETLTSENPHWASNSMDCHDDCMASGICDEQQENNEHNNSTPSKHALNRQAEVPVWSDSVADNKAESADKDTNKDSALGTIPALSSDIDPVNAEWPSEAHCIPLQPGSMNLSLTVQPHFVRALIKAAICQVTGDILVVDAYPPMTSINDYFQNLLVNIANDDLDLEVLSFRIQTDILFVDYILRLVRLTFDIALLTIDC
ncbi:hypothetical protein C0993_002903 [Termitomyces sp. T159_Od127]|nr:hypothetical protein C0993_002903 [Termitomyces sp. T159_Od127]